MNNDFKRISPEEALQISTNEKKGRLKVFLGYAPGVGKTFAMLNEANRRHQRGQDIVIGYLESHGRIDTDNQIGSLEVLPRKKIEYNGIILEELDTEAVINRHPETVLIDELAHTNALSSRNEKRYQDVQEILNRGINVITTINIQHLESLNDVVKQITGIKVRETIPDNVVQNASEVVVVDLSTDALLNRLKRGDIYKLENTDRALQNFFRKGNLNALREIALRQTAEEVDEDLSTYMANHDIKDSWPTVERILVCISTVVNSQALVRKGSRIAKRYNCEWIVVNVNCTNIFYPKQTKNNVNTLNMHIKLAKELGAEVVTLTNKSVSAALTKFAMDEHITQIVIGHENRTKWQTLWRGSTVQKLLNQMKDIEIHIIPTN